MPPLHVDIYPTYDGGIDRAYERELLAAVHAEIGDSPVNDPFLSDPLTGSWLSQEPALANDPWYWFGRALPFLLAGAVVVLLVKRRS